MTLHLFNFTAGPYLRCFLEQGPEKAMLITQFRNMNWFLAVCALMHTYFECFHISPTLYYSILIY